MSTKEEKEKILLEIELRKVKALEKIGNALDALTIWFEEVDKDEWSGRIQYYLSEFHGKVVKDGEVIIKDSEIDDVYKTDED
jgi:hypothetical protein